MSDDPDEAELERATRYKNPEYATELLEQIDWHLRYKLPEIKFWLIAIAALLVLILWRVWR